MAEVKPFQFNKDKYEEMKDVYIGILSSFGVENPEQFLESKVAEIPENKRNGLMFNGIIDSLFIDENENEALRQASEAKKRVKEAEKKGNKDEIDAVKKETEDTIKLGKQARKSIDAKRQKRAREALEAAKESNSTSPYIIAYLAEMSDQYIPFDTVLTAGKMVGEGKSLQMGCGEGKTGVLSMAAYAKLQQPGKQIFLTSSTRILAEEALDKLVFYENVGIPIDQITLITPDGIVKGKIDKNTGKLMVDADGKPQKDDSIKFKGKTEEEIKSILAEAYRSSLVSSDNTTLMQHAMKGYLPKPEPGIDRELLADEADFVLLDSYRPLQQTEEMIKEEQLEVIAQRNMAYSILKGLKDLEGLYDIDDANQYVDFTKVGREKVIDAINQRVGSNESIDKNKIFDYVYDALVVETVYKENRDYQILNEGKTIVSEDRASGVSIDLPEGVKQALEIKLKAEGKYIGEISEERRVLDTLNAQSFFSEFFNGTKHFISGTLGIDSDEIKVELRDNFNVDIDFGDVYDIPPQKARKRDDQGKNIFYNSDEKRKAIIDNAIKEIEAGRPVLIGTVSEEEIKVLREELESRGLGDQLPRILEYTAASKEIFKEDKENLSQEEFSNKYGVSKEQYGTYADLIKIESGKGNVVTLGTSIIGRGTTIKTSDEIDEKGGIHVILDGLHETSSRNQEQYKARTARGSNAGSTKEFFSLEDIPEEYRAAYEAVCKDGIVEGERAEAIYQSVYKKIDQRTSNIRSYVVEFVKATRDQLVMVEQLPIKPKEKEEIKALITARAFSIKNRACGVSSRFKDRIDEYKKEIEAYGEMYVAKYFSKEKQFDEIQWLEANGYGELARVHIPFSKEREQGIFTLAGVAAHAHAAREGVVNDWTKQTKDVVLGRSTEAITQENSEGEVEIDD